MTLYDYLETEYIKRFPAHAGYFFVFYIDAIGLFLPEGVDINGIPISDPATQLTDIIILKGQGKGIGIQSVILFADYQVAEDIANPDSETGTVSHEILHGLGLHHSFANDDMDKNALYPEQKFVFSRSLYLKDAGGNIARRKVCTDNVMDYPPASLISTWFWQWKIVNK